MCAFCMFMWSAPDSLDSLISFLYVMAAVPRVCLYRKQRLALCIVDVTALAYELQNKK